MFPLSLKLKGPPDRFLDSPNPMTGECPTYPPSPLGGAQPWGLPQQPQTSYPVSAHTLAETLGLAPLLWPALYQVVYLQDLTSPSEPLSPVVPGSREATALTARLTRTQPIPLSLVCKMGRQLFLRTGSPGGGVLMRPGAGPGCIVRSRPRILRAPTPEWPRFRLTMLSCVRS